MADIKANIDGDLDLGEGLKIAEDQDRDRHIVTVRATTVRGDATFDPQLGVSPRSIGRSIDGELLVQVEQDVRESIFRDIGALDVEPIVRALPTGPNEITVLIQLNKIYEDSLGKLVITANYWNRDEDITLLDGSEG